MPYDDKTLAKHREQMTKGEAIAVTLVTHHGQRAEGEVRHLRLTPQEANAQARRWLFICLAIAPFTIAFPPHIPWPIAAVVVGFIGYHARNGRTELIVCGEASCPKCGAFQILDGGNVEFPMAHFCTECKVRSLLEPTTALPEKKG